MGVSADKPHEGYACLSCVNSYIGADLKLRCRVHHNGLSCSPAAADGCSKYEREAGSDDWLEVSLCSGCVGRGD